MLKITSLFFVFCLTKSVLSQVPLYGQCGGASYLGAKNCVTGTTCFYKDSLYAQCLFSCHAGWQCDPREYDQCNGEGWSGRTYCPSGLTCFRKDKWYSQCLKSCPTGQGWECGQSGVTSSPSTTGSAVVSTGNKFPNCQFRFGAEFKGGDKDYSHLDYISIWIGYDDWGMVDMLRTAVRFKKMPLFYGYIIAFMARQLWGLQDCDHPDPNVPKLCYKGSEFLRVKKWDVVMKYKFFATETAKIIGRDTEMVWLIEPDFWQYYGDQHQEGGPCTGQFMRQFYEDVAFAIKGELPNARISWDISAWIGEQGMRTWWGFFASSPYVDYLHTSGGQSQPYMNYKPGELTWSFLSQLTGRKIIADTGYGVIGASQGHTYAWDELDNLKWRQQDGVIAITQANARWDWGGHLSYLRQNLPKFC